MTSISTVSQNGFTQPEANSASNIIKISNIDELSKILIDANLPTDKWIKPVSNLLNEINNGETVLEIINGELYRRVEVVSVRCLYKSQTGENYKLVEDRQEFKSGTTRKRNFDYIAEKISPSESPLAAALRGLSEELQISGDNLSLQELPEQYEECKQYSPSYLGLKCMFKKHWFVLQMPEDKYNKDGYKEEQSDKTTYFTWQKV